MTLKKKKYEIARLRILLVLTTLKYCFAKSNKDLKKAELECASLELQIQIVIAMPLPKKDATFSIVGETKPEVIITKNTKL